MDAGTDTELMSELPDLSLRCTEMGSYEGRCPSETGALVSLRFPVSRGGRGRGTCFVIPCLDHAD